MKFGKTFLTHQIPEWSIFYMNYKNLKKLIKNIDYDFNPSETEISDLVNSILSQFFYQLDRNIEKVDTFYNTKFVEYSRRLNKIIGILAFQDDKITHEIDSKDELDEVLSILLELKNFFRNLKWFGELNHKGFVKILKKLDKKLSYLSTLSNNHLESQAISLPNNNRENYLNTRVNALPFANEVELRNSLAQINSMLHQLSFHEVQLKQNEPEKIKDDNTDYTYSFDSLFLTNFQELIEKDQSESLISELQKIPANKKTLKFVLSLLSRATSKNSIHCIDKLFDILTDLLREDHLSTDNLLYDRSDINGRNFFHHIFIHFGKQQLIKEGRQITPGGTPGYNRLYDNNGPDGDKLSPVNLEGLTHVLKKIDDNSEYYNLRFLLNGKDNYLRTPLHYAAQYGIKDAVKLILIYLDNWALISKALPIDDVKFWGDQEGLTPMHLAVVGRHPRTTEFLSVYSHTTKLTCQNLILLAVRLDCPEILGHLINSGKIDVNFTDFEHNNETSLYIAAKLNLVNVVEFLLTQGANTEIGEMVFGWTPIFAAASEGYEEVTRLLLEHKSVYDLVDNSGWLPMEHATLRGHMKVADLLTPSNTNLLLYDINNPANNMQRIPVSSVQSPALNPNLQDDSLVLSSTSSIDVLPEPNKNAVNEVYKQLKQLDSSNNVTVGQPSRSKSPIHVKRIKPVKSFGHRYLNDDESLILITLGSTDLEINGDAVELNDITSTKSLITELDTALSLVVTCRKKTSSESVEPPVVIDLPLEDHHGSATDPITFKLTNHLSSDDVIVTFDIVPTYQFNQTEINLPFNKSDKLLGRAVALLDNTYTKVGPHLRSLHNVVSVPIVETKTLDILGSVKFEFMCVKPFSHKKMKIGRSDTYWKQLVSTRVIGHRGLGKNVNDKKSLQLGENTVESFIAAASLGASYVEFDVQLTKDSVPVIYHDFLVAESGVDIPMHSLTAEQFLHLNDQEDSFDKAKNKFKYELSNNSNTSLSGNGSNGATSPVGGQTQTFAMDDEILGKFNRPRSMAAYKSAPNMAKVNSGEQFDSDEEIDREVQDQISRRMKLTKTWKSKGYKGNARGLNIASDFVTLRDLFRRIPKNVGFNIELKYPMLDEAEDEGMGELAYDLNYYIDTILKVVYDENLTDRDIIFSSFHPDVCLFLSLKQPNIPILYLTESGTHYFRDIRASSLQNAIRFAKKWNLLGIVSAAETFVKTPRLAQVVKSSGLVCVTYGVLNNSPENCKIQMKAGVDAVIADSVLAVREGLRKDQESLKQQDVAF